MWKTDLSEGNEKKRAVKSRISRDQHISSVTHGNLLFPLQESCKDYEFASVQVEFRRMRRATENSSDTKFETQLQFASTIHLSKHHFKSITS